MDKRLISTCYANVEQDCEKFTALWRLPENDGPLEKVADFPSEKYGTDVKVLNVNLFLDLIDPNCI